jgi:uncharacterized RDD family membrane protein YckC
VLATTTCTVCSNETPVAWPRCATCGSQRVLHADGSLGGYRRYAGVWRRASAVLVDLVIVLGPFVVVLALLPDRERLDLAAVAFLALVAYQLGLLAWSGDTWGKRLLRAHVVEDDGRPIGRGRVTAREGVAKILEISALAVPVGIIALIAGTSDSGDTAAAWVAVGLGLPALAAFVWCVFDERRRTLHDRMSGTVCVRGRPVSPPPRFTRV